VDSTECSDKSGLALRQIAVIHYALCHTAVAHPLREVADITC